MTTARSQLKSRKAIYLLPCTQFRGKCDFPYIREEVLGTRLGKILLDIHIPDAILVQLQESLLADGGRYEKIREQQDRVLNQRLAQVQRRLDQAYQDKLDGKISEEFWESKSAEWQSEEQRVLSSIRSLKAEKPGRLLDAARISELANRAYLLYEKQSPASVSPGKIIVAPPCPSVSTSG